MAFGSGGQKPPIQGVSTGGNPSNSLERDVTDGPENTPWTGPRTAPARRVGGQGPWVPPGQGGWVSGNAGDLLTVAEAAALLKVSRATVYRLVKEGAVPVTRVSHSIRHTQLGMIAVMSPERGKVPGDTETSG